MNIINGADVATEYAKMPKDPIEVRVTKYEMNDGMVVECPFEWVDLGTWESLEEYLRKFGKYNNENVLEIEGKGNFVQSKKFTAVIGLDDVEIIETNDALLVVKKDKSGKVGEVVDFLKTKNPDLI
jgi:mannose-1-phosphate guanylyltransferase